MSERLDKIEALRVCTDNAANSEMSDGAVDVGAIGAVQHRATVERGNRGGIAVLVWSIESVKVFGAKAKFALPENHQETSQVSPCAVAKVDQSGLPLPPQPPVQITDTEVVAKSK